MKDEPRVQSPGGLNAKISSMKILLLILIMLPQLPEPRLDIDEKFGTKKTLNGLYFDYLKTEKRFTLVDDIFVPQNGKMVPMNYGGFFLDEPVYDQKTGAIKGWQRMSMDRAARLASQFMRTMKGKHYVGRLRVILIDDPRRFQKCPFVQIHYLYQP